MDEKRAKTLEALSTFIESQRALLARTQSDIERLNGLRNEVASIPAESCSLDYFSERLEGLRISELDDVVPNIDSDIDWSLFASSDPAPLRFLNTTLKERREQQQQPSTKQTAPLSALQSLVKAERITIIDPILSSFPELSEDEEEEPPDPEELRRIQERAKIRDLKVRRVHGDPGLYGLSGLALRKPGSEAVFVRRDAEDESAEVDISLDEPVTRQADPSTSTTPSSALDLNMDLDTSATSVASPPPSHSGKMLPPAATPARNRRATAKASTSRTQTVKKSKPHIKSGAPLVVEESSGKTERPQVEKKGKPRPETYKQAWSMEEQHLLERLLEEIPDGEKNRWSKISQAMSGRRTARQVASRVQKYYEKLKRFGVDVNAGSSRANDS